MYIQGQTPAEIELKLTKQWIESVLNNDETSTDSEIVELLEANSTIEKQKLENIVANERPKFLLDWKHEVDWKSYQL